MLSCKHFHALAWVSVVPSNDLMRKSLYFLPSTIINMKQSIQSVFESPHRNPAKSNELFRPSSEGMILVNANNITMAYGIW